MLWTLIAVVPILLNGAHLTTEVHLGYYASRGNCIKAVEFITAGSRGMVATLKCEKLKIDSL